MKGVVLFLVLFFALCSSTTVYLTSYYTSNCASSSGYSVTQFSLTTGQCLQVSFTNTSYLLNGDGSVSYFANVACNGSDVYSIPSGGACVNTNSTNPVSVAQTATSGSYIEFEPYSDSNCTNPKYPFTIYFPSNVCISRITSSFIYSLNGNNVSLQLFSSSNCTGTSINSSFPFGCNPNSNGAFYYNSSALTPSTSGTITGSSITGSPVTGSSVTGFMTGSSITGSSVTGSSVTGTSVTGSMTSQSTTGSSPSSNSNLFYPSILILVISLFLASLF